MYLTCLCITARISAHQKKEQEVKNLFVLGLALAVTTGVSFAGEIKSGPQAGDRLGAFNVTKCAGAEKDGVPEGGNLCYRCRNSRKPQVVVFTRSTDPEVIELVKQIDAAITKNKDSKLTSFVNVLGADKDELSATAKSLAKTTKATNVPFVVPNEFENGPDNYGLNPKAAVTIILADGIGVKANHAVTDVKELKADTILADLKKIL